MADSFRTQREDRVAIRRLPGAVRLRVAEVAPYPRDIHPLPKTALERFLRKVPNEFLHGLRSIELQPRNHAVGRPFAHYRPTDRTIVLFSIPVGWQCSARARSFIAEVEEYGAVVTKENGVATIAWPKKRDLQRWFEFDVVGHELAHHFRTQFRHKNGRMGRYWEEERMADQTVERLWKIVRHQKYGAGSLEPASEQKCAFAPGSVVRHL